VKKIAYLLASAFTLATAVSAIATEDKKATDPAAHEEMHKDMMKEEGKEKKARHKGKKHHHHKASTEAPAAEAAKTEAMNEKEAMVGEATPAVEKPAEESAN